MKQKNVNHEEQVIQRMANDEYAVEYLNAALESEEVSLFLVASKRLVQARGIKMAVLARNTGLDRAGLYRMLSAEGNPEWKTLVALLQQLGFGVSVTPQDRLETINSRFQSAYKRVRLNNRYRRKQA